MDEQRLLSLEHDIMERKDIIDRFYMYGILERDEAIRKIQELRVANSEVAKATAIELARNRIPFGIASNNQIVDELRMQVGILMNEMALLNNKEYIQLEKVIYGKSREDMD